MLLGLVRTYTWYGVRVMHAGVFSGVNVLQILFENVRTVLIHVHNRTAFTFRDRAVDVTPRLCVCLSSLLASCMRPVDLQACRLILYKQDSSRTEGILIYCCRFVTALSIIIELSFFVLSIESKKYDGTGS